MQQCIYTGQGATQNYKKAFKYYKLAADQGHAKAQHNIGVMYGKGQGTLQNYQKALKYITLAADQGNLEALATVEELQQVGI